jgi:hypothetical protein
MQDSKTPFSRSKLPWARESISPKIVDSQGMLSNEVRQLWSRMLNIFNCLIAWFALTNLISVVSTRLCCSLVGSSTLIRILNTYSIIYKIKV